MIVIDVVHDRAISVLFLGVQFPLDMLGAILVTAIGILLMMPFREWIRWTVVLRLAEPLYRRNFALTIGKKVGFGPPQGDHCDDHGPVQLA